MGYVEECKKHGQYKGDECGECIDDLRAELEQTKEAFLAEHQAAVDMFGKYDALKEERDRLYAENITYGAALERIEERLLVDPSPAGVVVALRLASRALTPKEDK